MHFDVPSSEVVDRHFIASTARVAAIGNGGFGIEGEGAGIGEGGRRITPQGYPRAFASWASEVEGPSLDALSADTKRKATNVLIKVVGLNARGFGAITEPIR